jgi:hypothetical protein
MSKAFFVDFFSRLKTEENNSKILKNVFFQFFSSYFNLFMYSFSQQNFEKVSTQMSSMMISKNIFNILLVKKSLTILDELIPNIAIFLQN